MRRLITFAMIFTLAPAGFAHAADPLITGDAHTLGRGGLLLEFNGEYGFDRQAGIRERGGEAAVLVTYGLTDDIDLLLGVPYQWSRLKVAGETETTDGLADMFLEAKWRFYEAERGSYSLKPAISLPTGDEEKGLGNGKVSYGLTFTASRHLEPVDLHFNIGYLVNEFKLKADREENRRDIWHASLSAVRGVTDNLDLVGNVGIERNGARNSNRHPAFALAGLIYAMADNLDVYAGLKYGLTRAETDVTVLTGLAWRR